MNVQKQNVEAHTFMRAEMWLQGRFDTCYSHWRVCIFGMFLNDSQNDSKFRINLVVDFKGRLHLSKFLKKKRNFKEELLIARQVWNMLWEGRSVAGLFLLRSNLNHFLTGISQQNNKQTIKYTKYIQSKFIGIFLSKKKQ